MPVRRIESKQNATIKALRKAFANGELTEDGCVAIEGLKVIGEAARAGLDFRSLVISDSAPKKATLEAQQHARGAEVLEVPDDVFRSAVSTESPQGVAALAVLPPPPTLKEVIRRGALFVIAADIQDPGNLGTIIRSANAFGAAAIFLGEGTVSQFNAKVIRASAGSVFRIPCITSKLQVALKELKAAGVRLVGTSSHQGVALARANLKGGIAFLIGNEGSGLGAQVGMQTDEFVSIPIGDVESLNAGVAASLVLYEAARQRNGS